jgi:hypothetical protein
MSGSSTPAVRRTQNRSWKLRSRVAPYLAKKTVEKESERVSGVSAGHWVSRQVSSEEP